MSTTDYASLCAGSAACITEMTSLAAQVTHWRVAGITFLSTLLLALICLVVAKTVLKKRRARSKMIATTTTNDDNVEQHQQIWPVLVDVTCAAPTVVSVEYQRVRNVVREVTIAPRKPVKRMIAFVSQRGETDLSDDEESQRGDVGIRTGLPIDWFEMDSSSGEHC